MMRFLFLVSMFFQSTTSSVHILAADAEGNPLPHVRVELVLYEFRPGQTEVREIFSGRCSTDQNGECMIGIGETSGLLRGRLELGRYGGRDVIWPGGVLTAPVLVDLQNKRVKGTEVGAYDFQEKDGGITIQTGTSWLSILAATLIVGLIVFRAYVQSRREHAC
jgi:hypothetical protein